MRVSSCSTHELRRALAGALLTLSVSAAAGFVPAAASASSQAPARQRTLCMDKVTVRDSPYGYAIGHLFRPQRVTIVSSHAVNRYVLIRARSGLVGWIPNGALCPPARP